ncbi:MAG: TetR/AcrR family transcriptional regulator [Polyangiales bacterium]
MARNRADAEAALDPSSPPAADKTGARSTRSSKGARTRERLVEAAKEIFEEHGFLNARISDIAERAGQSHGSFYYYFDSKEEIFREVAAAVDQRLLFAPMQDVILASSGLPLQQRIREAMRRYLESYRKEAQIMGLIEHVARFDPVVNTLRLNRHKQHSEQVAETIRQLQRKKLADPKLDPMITAAALGALTHRFAEMWFVHGAIDITMKQAIEQLSTIYANALRLTDSERKA